MRGTATHTHTAYRGHPDSRTRAFDSPCVHITNDVKDQQASRVLRRCLVALMNSEGEAALALGCLLQVHSLTVPVGHLES